MTISNDTYKDIYALFWAHPWGSHMSRSYLAPVLHRKPPEATEKEFVPTGQNVELPLELLPEVPEGVMVGIETMMEVGK